MMVQRKLMSGEKEVERLFDMATLYDFDVIELVWTKTGQRGDTRRTVHGFEVPVEKKKGTRDIDNPGAIKFVIGTVVFCPDERGMRYGYIADTPKNRQKLVNSFKTGWYRIQDKRVKQECLDMALEAGLPTERLAKPEIHIKKSVREQRVETENEKLKRELAEAKKALQEAEKTGKAKIERPLSKTKIKDREKKQEALKEDS